MFIRGRYDTVGDRKGIRRVNNRAIYCQRFSSSTCGGQGPPVVQLTRIHLENLSRLDKNLTAKAHLVASFFPLRFSTLLTH